MALGRLRVDMAVSCGRIINAETATRGFVFLPGFPKTAYTFGRSEPAIVTGRNPATVSATEQWRAHFVNKDGGAMAKRKYDREQQDRYYRNRKRWDKIRNHMTNLVYERDGKACANCGASKDLTIDHIVPLAYDGTNDEDNLQVLCLSCNCSKGVS